MLMFELLVSVHVPGAGQWTDCISLSASSLDEAKIEASEKATDILQDAPGDARLRSGDGRIIWLGSKLLETTLGEPKIDLITLEC